MTILRLEVAGRVQGVGFRWFIREQARARGLSGWARNLSNGNVELCVGGEDAAVKELRRLVAVGPEGADVRQVLERPPQASEPLPFPFTILK